MTDSERPTFPPNSSVPSLGQDGGLMPAFSPAIDRAIAALARGAFGEAQSLLTGQDLFPSASRLGSVISHLSPTSRTLRKAKEQARELRSRHETAGVFELAGQVQSAARRLQALAGASSLNEDQR